jgi:hypothetical protein
MQEHYGETELSKAHYSEGYLYFSISLDGQKKTTKSLTQASHPRG